MRVNSFNDRQGPYEVDYLPTKDTNHQKGKYTNHFGNIKFIINMSLTNLSLRRPPGNKSSNGKSEFLGISIHQINNVINNNIIPREIFLFRLDQFARKAI